MKLTDPRRKKEIPRDGKKAGRDTPMGLCSILKHERTRLKVRHAFVMMLCAILLMSLSVGCGTGAEPVREGQTHILQDGFRNTNPAFAPPSLWERLTVPPIADVDNDVSHTNCRFASR